MTRDPTPAPPHIPDYELLREIGRGSYGTVWLARSVTGLHRAVKIVWRGSFDDPQPYEREFRGIKEFAAVSLLESRQLALLHVGRNDAEGFFYYVMELADDANSGREIDPQNYVPYTLRELRGRRGRLPADEALTLAVDLAGALAGLHAHRLVHRDIKPSNIIFVGGVPKLADIGLVTSAATAEATISRVGNAGYMPPDFPGTPSADVYGLGKVLYEIATGRERDDYPRLPADLDKLPDRKALLELNEIFIRACAPQVEKRYPSAAPLRDDLLLLQAGKSVRRLRAAERRLSQAMRAAAILGVAAAVAAAAAWLATREMRREMALRAVAEKQRDELARKRTYSGNLASTQSALARGDLSRARQLLQELAPRAGEADLRHFEWHSLWHQALGDPRREIRKTGHPIDKLLMSPDETVLAAFDRSGSITLYDPASLGEVRRITGVGKVAGFSANGKWLVGADKAGNLVRWAVDDGRAEKSPEMSPGLPIAAVGDSRVITLAAGSAPRLRSWDFAANRETDVVELGMNQETPEWGDFIADASRDGTVLVRVWRRYINNRVEYRLTHIDLRPAACVQHTDCGTSRPSAVGVDSTGAWALFDPPESESEGVVWRPGEKGWEPTHERLPRGTAKVIEPISSSSTGRILAKDRELRWAGTDRSAPKRARGHDATISQLVAAPRHGRLFSAATDGSLFCWELAGPSSSPLRIWNSNAGATRAVFSIDAKRLWIPEDGVSCALLDLRTLTVVERAAGMRYPLALVGDTLWGVGAEVGLPRVDAKTGRPLSPVLDARALRIAALSADGARIAAIDERGELLDGTAAALQPVAKDLQYFVSMAFDRQGQRLWMTNPTNRELVILAWPGGKRLARVTLAARIATFLALPGEEHLVIALDNGNMEIRHSSSGLLVREIYSGSSAPQALALSPDGGRLFVGGIEGNIHCFDPKSWEEVHSLPVDSSVQLHRLVCSPDGRTLAALTKTGALYLLQTD